MFRLRDGRSELFQWDSDLQLIVEDGSISEVHFCNKTDTCSLVCEVYEQDGLRLVNVPNILLQDAWPIRVYGYCGCYTKEAQIFKVLPRSKPEDYIYTETEIKRFAALEERMDEVEKVVTAEGVANAVEEYLTKNPIEAGATEEEAAQIAKNAADIKELQEKEVDLTGYATEKYVNNAVAAIKIPDVSGFLTEIPAEYLTESELEGKGYITTIPEEYITEETLSTKGFLTQTDLDEQLSEIGNTYYRIKNPDPNSLTEADIAFLKEYLNYARQNNSYMPVDIYIIEGNTNLVDMVHCGRSGAGGSVQFRYFYNDIRKVAYYYFNTSTGEFDATKSYCKVEYDHATMEEVEAKGYLTEHQSLEGYALKSEIPDVSGYQTEEQVLALIAEHGGGTSLPASEEAEF